MQVAETASLNVSSRDVYGEVAGHTALRWHFKVCCADTIWACESLRGTIGLYGQVNVRGRAGISIADVDGVCYHCSGK